MRFGIAIDDGTVRTWVRNASAYAMAPESSTLLPLGTKVKQTLRKLIKGMVADHYGCGPRYTDDTLKEIQDDLGQVGARIGLADIREALRKIEDELGPLENVD